MSKIVEFVPSHVSADLVATLETLLQGARIGHVTGLAFVAMLRRGRYMTAWSGPSVEQHPTLALGGAVVLADELSNLIRHRDPEDTR